MWQVSNILLRMEFLVTQQDILKNKALQDDIAMICDETSCMPLIPPTAILSGVRIAKSGYGEDEIDDSICTSAVHSLDT